MKIRHEFEGFYRLEVRKADTNRLVHDTGWFPNLILDAGLNRFGTGEIGTYCQVGTSNTAPAVGQTSLVAQIANSGSYIQTGPFYSGAPDYYGALRRKWRFLAGTATGNLSEVGVGWATTGNLWSRALIVDGGGAPTTITILADEVLDVTYELRTYVDVTDHSDQIMIGPVLHDYILRAANVNSWIATGDYRNIFAGFQASGGSPGQGSVVYAGPLGAITGLPAGASSNTNVVSFAAYSNNSLKRAATYTWGLTDGNIVGGIGAASVYNSIGEYQLSFNPPIAKTSSKVLTLTFEYTWSRRVIP